MVKALWQQAAEYEARLDRQLIRALWTPGVVIGCDVSSVTGMQVKMSPGLIAVEGKDSTNQGTYLAFFETDQTKPVPARPATGSRIDILGTYITDTVDGAGAVDEAQVQVYSGVATTGAPVAPTLPLTAQEVARWMVSSTDTEVGNITAGVKSFLLGTTAPGVIEMYAGDVAPAGFLMCRGGTALRNQYPRLFGILGTKFGAGDGTTTFGLPDFRGQYPIGFNQGGSYLSIGVGERYGNKDAAVISHFHALDNHYHGMPHQHHSEGTTGGQSQSHYHAGRDYQNVLVEYNPAGPNGWLAAGTAFGVGLAGTNWASHDHGHWWGGWSGQPSNANTGWGTGANAQWTGESGVNRNLPPSLSINFIIKF